MPAKVISDRSLILHFLLSITVSMDLSPPPSAVQTGWVGSTGSDVCGEPETHSCAWCNATCTHLHIRVYTPKICFLTSVLSFSVSLSLRLFLRPSFSPLISLFRFICLLSPPLFLFLSFLYIVLSFSNSFRCIIICTFFILLFVSVSFLPLWWTSFLSSSAFSSLPLPPLFYLLSVLLFVCLSSSASLPLPLFYVSFLYIIFLP